MRTTVTLEDDVATAVDDLRRQRGVGVSAAINELIRRGLAAPKERPRFVQRSHPIGLKINVDDVAEALEHLDRIEAEERVDR